MKPIIEARNLGKTYIVGMDEVHALRGVSLTINEGEFVAIMGPSGSGKSTFMNVLGCLDRPTYGQYLLNGEDVSPMSDTDLASIRNRYVGFVFQTFHLLPRSTAQGNVELPLVYSGVKNRTERALKALDTVGLADRVHHKPNELSGGQQQRVAIARAIVNDPVVVFGDEPTGNLDTRTSEEIMALFQELNRRGKTVVIVTHEPDIANHCHRVVRFRDGLIIGDDEVHEPVDAREVLSKLPRASLQTVQKPVAGFGFEV